MLMSEAQVHPGDLVKKRRRMGLTKWTAGLREVMVRREAAGRTWSEIYLGQRRDK